MQTVIIVVHLMVVLSLIGVVLLQRSEGGALGVGGGSGFMTSRGQANVLTRATAILAAAFFVTSLSLSILAGWGRAAPSVFDRVSPGPSPASTAPDQPSPPLGSGQGGILPSLRQMQAPPTATPSGAPSSPASGEPAPPLSNGGTPSVPAPAQ